MSQHGHALARRRLGTELRRLREEAGLLIEQVAGELECSTSKISRLENGKGVPKMRDVRDMLGLYSVEDAELRDELLDLAREGQQPGWWEDYADMLQPDSPAGDHLDTYLALETDASALLSFQPNLMHGLLQTPSYTHAVIEALAYPQHAPHGIERFVELRLRRQEVLSRPSRPLRLHLVMDEAVLRRPIGDHHVMREQLRKVLREAEKPNVTVQVVPFDVGVHQAVVGQFEILEFAGSTAQEVVYIESLTGSAYRQGESDVLHYRQAFDDVAQKALDPARSREFILQTLTHYIH